MLQLRTLLLFNFYSCLFFFFTPPPPHTISLSVGLHGNGNGIVVFSFVPSVLPKCVVASSNHVHSHRNAKGVVK